MVEFISNGFQLTKTAHSMNVSSEFFPYGPTCKVPTRVLSKSADDGALIFIIKFEETIEMIEHDLCD
tara:strand:- start:196 stop:396 length:201 start_codon:yes stop_codon:yes gene_type:complete